MSFVKSRFDNFSAYYNTYYNAERVLDEGIEGFQLSVEDAPIDQTQFVSLYGSNESGVTRRQPFEDAIVKCADVLRDHPNSKWVDDATLCIGKAWFFTRNFVGAEQKFREVLALESPLQYEARFWLARTYIASGAYNDAYDHLQSTLGDADLSRRWEPQYRLALAELHVTRQDWEEAALELEMGLPDIRDSDLASRAQLLLGQVYEKLRLYDEAINAYVKVQRFKPWYELSYAAHYSAIRVLIDHGDAEEAMHRLRKMERDDKNYDYRDELGYLRARAHQALGEYDEAFDMYYYLLYDEMGRSNAVRGHVHYALGKYYRDVELDFQFAAVHFDTASTTIGRSSSRGSSASGRATSRPTRSTASSSQSSGDESFAPGAITDSQELARVFGEFAGVMDRIFLMDSLLYLGSMDDSTFADFVMDLRQKRAKELEEQQREYERRMAERGFGGAMQSINDRFSGLPSGKNVGQGELGFLHHLDRMQVQQARQEFETVWGDRPLARNWRRNAAVMAADTSPDSLDGLGNQVQFDGALPEVDVSGVPRDSLAQEEMFNDLRLAWYELGNVLFLSINRPDSAAFWYREVVQENDDDFIAQRAYYALGEVQRALGDSLGANRIFREIVSRFPDSEFTVRASEHLNLPAPETTVTDSLLLAEAFYDTHLGSWKEGLYEPSMQGMMETAQEYATTPVAPRALLAAGTIYMDWATSDSLSLFEPVPLTDSSAAWVRRGVTPPIPDSASVELKSIFQAVHGLYPQSEQAKRANGIIEALDEAWASMMAPIDSLRRADSLAVIDSLYTIDSLAVMAVVDSLILSDSLLVEVTTDSLIAGIRDSLFVQVKDSIDAAEKLAGAAVTAEATTEESTAPEPGSDAGLSAGLSPGLSTEPVPQKEGKPKESGLPPPGKLSDPGLGNIDWSPGGYGILITTLPDYDASVGFATNFGRSFPFPIDILPPDEGGNMEFRLALGLFSTINEAQQVMQQIGGQLPPEATIIRIPRAASSR